MAGRPRKHKDFTLDTPVAKLTPEQLQLRREYGNQRQKEYYARVCSDPVAYKEYRDKNNACSKKCRERKRNND